MIQAKIVADSTNPLGKRLTTFELDYPLFIHAELMTHRVFSRNAASSRAIPFETLAKNVQVDPAITVKIAGHQKGMQVGEDLPKEVQEQFARRNQCAMSAAMYHAKTAHDSGVHKSIVNRWLGPWVHIKTLVTSHDYDNFFALRAHKDAEPNFQVLAYKMLKEYLGSAPNFCQWGDWHLPYDAPSSADLTLEERIKISVARACWTSYSKPGKEIATLQDAFDRHDSAAESGHWSPFEHVAQAIPGWYKRSNFDIGEELCGWKQYRKDFVYECARRSGGELQYLLDEAPDWIKELLK
jgi:thymidylate synthase ThyX